MSGYWPWWAGAIALGTLTPLVLLLSGRPLGVSGFWSRLLNRKSQLVVARDFVAAQDQDAFDNAMRAATLAEFGEHAVQDSTAQAPARNHERQVPPVPWLANATFLMCISLGGLLAQWSRGSLQSPDLTVAAREAAGVAWPVLLLGGGVLVGFGARMAGGCTSGHGLSGCATLQPGSFAAIAAFFAGGVAVAFLLGGS